MVWWKHLTFVKVYLVSTTAIQWVLDCVYKRFTTDGEIIGKVLGKSI